MRATAGPGCQQRLMSTLDTYFQAIMQQASDRGSRNIPDLEEYILLRRDTSGCKTGFAFIEYAANIDLPDEVIEHPIIKAMADSTNDLVSWANVSVLFLTGFTAFCCASAYGISDRHRTFSPTMRSSRVET